MWPLAASRIRIVRKCRACGTVIWYPRAICPQCHAMDVEWIDATGHGTIYSFSIVRRGGYTRGKDYVLGRFTTEQRKLLEPAIDRATGAILTWIDKGIEPAMSQFNADEKE